LSIKFWFLHKEVLVQLQQKKLKWIIQHIQVLQLQHWPAKQPARELCIQNKYVSEPLQLLQCLWRESRMLMKVCHNQSREQENVLQHIKVKDLVLSQVVNNQHAVQVTVIAQFHLNELWPMNDESALWFDKFFIVWSMIFLSLSYISDAVF